MTPLTSNGTITFGSQEDYASGKSLAPQTYQCESIAITTDEDCDAKALFGAVASLTMQAKWVDPPKFVYRIRKGRVMRELA